MFLNSGAVEIYEQFQHKVKRTSTVAFSRTNGLRGKTEWDLETLSDLQSNLGEH